MRMLRQRGDTYHYDFTIRGQRHRGSTQEKSFAAARRFESDLMVEIKNGNKAAINRIPPTLNEFQERFFKWLEATGLEVGTKTYYDTGWKLLKDSRLASLRLTDITTDEAATVKLGKGPSNANCAFRTLRRMLGKASEWGLIAKPPRIKLAKETGRQELIEPWMEQKLLLVAKGSLRDVLLIMLDSGMRPSEIFRMRWVDIQWERGTIFVPKGKTPKARRYVPLTDRVRQALEVRRPKQEGQWVFPTSKLMPTKCGHIVSLQNAWRKARKDAGLPDTLKLYCARHTFATNALDLTGNLAAVMQAMGHSGTAVAMRYQHPDVLKVRDAMDAKNGRVM
jgi:integrase